MKESEVDRLEKILVDLRRISNLVSFVSSAFLDVGCLSVKNVKRGIGIGDGTFNHHSLDDVYTSNGIVTSRINSLSNAVLGLIKNIESQLP